MAHHGMYYTTTTAGYCIALAVLMSFVALNYFGVRFFVRINATFTIWKLLIPGCTIVILLSMSYQAKNFFQYGGLMPYGFQGVMKAISSGGVLFSLLGFRQVIIMMHEIENPGKYVPVVLVSSLVVTTLLYTGLQWSFIGSMRAVDLNNGWANLSFPGDAGPFAALASLAGIVWLSRLLYIDAFISPYSTGLVYATTAATMLASMDHASSRLSLQNQYQAPWVSLCANFLIGAVMFSLLQDWQAMSAFLVAVLMISYSIGPICLICLRRQLPDHYRPFRLRYGKTIAFIGFYVCTAGVYWAGFSSILKLLILFMSGLVIYLFYMYLFKRSSKQLDVKHAIWLLCYLIGLSIFSYFGNYGGKQLLAQYWDLLYLMIFSLIIFSFAYFSQKKSNECI